ncbi:MAG: hypothetical protein CMN89_09815 [Sutterellaceae bacterium]|nr:hypothetical protein [Sutterellaceae bacterium]MBT84761.1 hypothetical protein [Sutterellaceae bacterium]HAV74693.1 hypothetical protein [Limnobacter sp.]
MDEVYTVVGGKRVRLKRHVFVAQSAYSLAQSAAITQPSPSGVCGRFANGGASANSAVGLPVTNFKKTAPFGFIRCVWRLANTETRPCVLPSEVSKNEFKKG